MSNKANTLPVGVPRVKYSFRRHVVPPLGGVAAMVVVYSLLNFSLISARIQYLVSEYNAPKVSTSALIGSAPQTNESQIIIPSIQVKAPVIYSTSKNNTDIAYDLRSGVVHYSTTANPGEQGNVVIFGHSSGVAWAPGNYKFVFTLLDKLKSGQQISLDYNGKRYVYVVTGSKIVAPTDMSVLDVGSESKLSLITCTPVGTSKNRLVVEAKQISPNPQTNKLPVISEKPSFNQIPSGN